MLVIFLDRFFGYVPKNFGFTVLVFIVVGEFPNFGTWFSVFIKSTNRFLDLVSEVVFDFSYWGSSSSSI